MRIGIIGAMSVEVEDLLSSMENKSIHAYCGLSFHTGTLEGVEVVVVTSGIGKVNAAMCVQLLVDRFQVEAIFNTGIAGAVDPRLHVGDFVVSTNAIPHDMDVTYLGYKPGQTPGLSEDGFKADQKLVDAVLESYRENGGVWGGQILAGRIASGDQFISTKEKKDVIGKLFHPLCVEMEGAAVAQACSLNNIPFAIIRCLSDTADESGTRKEYDFNEEVMAKRSASLMKGVISNLRRKSNG